MVAARLLGLQPRDTVEELQELSLLANWAKHAPPPASTAPLAAVPDGAVRACDLEEFRADLYRQEHDGEDESRRGCQPPEVKRLPGARRGPPGAAGQGQLPAVALQPVVVEVPHETDEDDEGAAAESVGG